ncbi:cytochrome P450 4V2 [Caerostris darwini]|uniref:Cytochrome P450 4V2 n=1 Tax=Caerostris darwini TaxID=1538125 RepID=A0AAV4R366_9ARAC|nr:cytochrome P450 4V2 [Caerostris darwini]
MPGSKVRFYNFLGNISDLPFFGRSRNGYSILVYIQQLIGAYGKMFAREKLYCLWLAFHPLIVLAKAEAVEVIFGGSKIIEKTAVYDWMEPFFGKGLLTSGGDKWKSRRKMLNSCFRYDILKTYVPILNDHSRLLVQRLQQETDKDSTKITGYLSPCTFAIMCETILGIRMDAQKSNKEEEFIHSANRGFRLLSRRLFNCFYWSDFFYYFSKDGKEVKKHVQVVRDFTKSLLQEEKQKYLSQNSTTNEGKSRSLINLLLTHHLQLKDFTEEDVIEELITIMLSGHDTTMISVAWTLYMLGLYPEVQAKVHEELDWIFGEDVERHATLDDLKDMKYLDCVIKETMRLYPPGHFLSRRITEDITICGYSIRKGATCVAFTNLLHRDEEVFPNPEKFDPDRFLPENSATRNSFAYIPFSIGPRNCIGQTLAVMEQLVITSTIMRNYTVESLDHRDVLLPAFAFVLMSVKPIRIKFRPRNFKKIP